MKDVTLDQVYAAMQAYDAEPGGDRADRRKIIEALRAARLWDDQHPARADVALSAYQNSYSCEHNREAATHTALTAVAELVTPKPKRTDIPFAEVLTAVRAEIEQASPDGWQVSSGLTRRIGGAVGFDATVAGGAFRQRGAEDKFSGQVSRAFSKLAGQGVLRKAGAGTTGPDGRVVHRNSVAYYTPEMWDAIAGQAAQRREAERAEGLLWADLSDRLDKLGVTGWCRSPRYGLTLDLEGWALLLELAGGGRSAWTLPS
jgi:hypothetical protein